MFNSLTLCRYATVQPSELEIRREVEVLRDLKRRSTAQGGPGAIPLDPDLPELPPSPSSPLNGNPWGVPEGTDDQQDGGIADDPAHLFWVPARLHPELAPKEFRAFLKEHAREGAAGLQRANSASATMSSSSSFSTLGRRKSMLSKQYQPSESDGVENERVIVRRNKSSIRAPVRQLTISDLQKLDELAEQISESDDPTKIRNMLRRSLSLNISPSLVADQTDDSIDVDDADSPIIPRGPNQILRRAARTKIRKPNLQGDGGGHRFPSTRRGRAQTIATSDGSEQDMEEPFHRPQAPSPEEADRERPRSHTDESFIVDSYADRRESLTSSESYSRSEEDSHVERRFTSSPPPLLPSVQQPSPEVHETQPQSTVLPSSLLHQPTPQRHLTAPVQTQAVAEVIPSRSPSPSYSESGSTTEMASSMPSLPPESESSSPAPGPSKSTKTRNPTSAPPRKEEKKGLFKWGSKDSKKKSKGESKEKPEKEKDSGFFGSLFGSKRKHEDTNTSSGLLHNGSGPATAAALLGASKANRANARSPSPQPVGNYARYPIHVERAIYRLSHIKLANARRPLLEQVLISNLMFWYLGVINKTTQPNISNSPSAAGGNAQSQNLLSEQQDKETQEQEHEQRENAEKERFEREKAEQLKENSRKGSLTRVPKPGTDSPRRADMPIRGPQYESQHRAMEQEYVYLNSNGGGYGYSNPGQGPAAASSPRMSAGPSSLLPNNSSYLPYNNICSPQPIHPARSGSPTGLQHSPQLMQPPGTYYFNYPDGNGQSQPQGMGYGLPPGAMLPTTAMDQTWLGVGGSGKSSPSPPPPSSSQNQYSYHPPSPSPPPSNHQHSQTPPRRPRSPPPNHLTNSHPRHPTTTPPGARMPGRSLSATAVPSQQHSGKLRKANAGTTGSGVRRRSSDGESYAEEDVPLAVWKQQQKAGGRR